MTHPMRLSMGAGVMALGLITLAGAVAAGLTVPPAEAASGMSAARSWTVSVETAPLMMAAGQSSTAAPTKTLSQSKATAPTTSVPNPPAFVARTTVPAEQLANPVELTVKVQKATSSGPGESLGSVSIVGLDAGVTFMLKLHGLAPGSHGFHVYEDAECGPIFLNGVRIPAGAAGGIWDPDHINRHAGPKGDGNLGDLPVIEVGSDGTTSQTLTAPRIKDIQSLRGHALVIRAGGDNYSDDPNPQGGGGLRIACGSIE